MKLFQEFSDVTVRTETIPEKSDLEKVLDTEEEIIRQYKTNRLFDKTSRHGGEGYLLLHASVQDKLREVNCSSEILRAYISMRDNSEEKTESIIRGMYSAALLEIGSTTESNENFFINGKGRTWNYLFYQVRHAKNITIEHFKGNKILSCAGSHKGNVENVIVNHVIGNEILQGAGNTDGTVKHLFLNDIQGNHTLASTGLDRGTAEHIALNQIRGDYTLAYTTAKDGHIHGITINKVKGLFTLDHINKYYQNNKSSFLYGIQMSTKQEEILEKMKSLIENMHTLLPIEQKETYKEIARLQKEIFLEKNMWKKAHEKFSAT